MLVLTRKTGERFFIGKDIVITIIRITPSSVRVGIDAPEDVNVVREELVHVTERPSFDALRNPR